jgi:DNA-binding FadR family transcriptional regulator
MQEVNSPKQNPRRSRPLLVADTIKEWVVKRDLSSGDKLPNEGAMIDQFGVSKGTVREALRILEAQGLIVTKTGPGGGSIVGEVSVERTRALLANYFYFQDLSIADIYQMRKSLEPELAASLAGKLSSEQILELRNLAGQYPQPAKSAEEEKEQHIASLAFHTKLSDYGKNKLLGFIIGFMSQILTELTLYKKLYEPPNYELWRKGREHQLQLIDALVSGDSNKAREIMASHMQVAETLMKQQEAQIVRRFIAE